MYEVFTRDVASRRLLSIQRHGTRHELTQIGKELIDRMRGVLRPEGITGAPFVTFYGEVSDDSDGPFEWNWPVTDEQADGAGDLAVRFPDLVARSEPSHQEAFVELKRGTHEAQLTVAMESLRSWTVEQGRVPSAAIRVVYSSRTPPDRQAGPDVDLAVPLGPVASVRSMTFPESPEPSASSAR